MSGIFIEVLEQPAIQVATYPVQNVDVEVLMQAPVVVLPTPMFVPVDVLVPGPAGPPGPSGFEGFTFSYVGPVSLVVGKGRQYFEANSLIDTVRASVDTPPSGSALIVDVLKNGVSIFATTGDRPTIAAGTNTAVGGTMTGASLSAGDYLTVSVTQVGSSTAGADLTVTVRVHKV